MSVRLAVTGASGFVGAAVVADARRRGYGVIPVSRRTPATLGLQSVRIDTLDASTDWSAALAPAGQGPVDCVIHCAAITGTDGRRDDDMRRHLWIVNVAATRRLAEQCAAAGVRRLVFLSSIKVNGEHTARGEAFLPSSMPNPEDAYGRSKLDAETALADVARQTGLEVVVVRPPLVYGPSVGGNLLRLMRLVSRGLPLPFRSVENRRSLIGIENLSDLVLRCVGHPAAAGAVLLAADGEDLSTPELVEQIARLLGRPPRLLPVPVPLLLTLGRLSGRSAIVQRLVESLAVDTGETRARLDWSPPVPVAQGMRRMVDWFTGTQ